MTTSMPLRPTGTFSTIVLLAMFTFCGAVCAQAVTSQTASTAPDVHLVWMGGSDCPPCVNWRKFDLPKLEKSGEFKLIKFSYVQKYIRSPVPDVANLPIEVQPFKEKLDIASNRRHGSPQAAVLVDGEVYDYFHGTRSAEEIEKMLIAIRTGAAYPFARCLKGSKQWQKCDLAG